MLGFTNDVLRHEQLVTDSEKLTLSTAEAAKILGISTSAVRRAVKANRLPYVRLARKILILREPLFEILRTGEAGDLARSAAPHKEPTM